jgi:hypothetical protein
MKLIALLRNPADRAVAAVYHLMNLGLLPVEDPDRQLDRILRSGGEGPIEQSILTQGFYGRSLNNYLKWFPAEALLVLRQEAFRESPGAAMIDVQRFLGVDTDRPSLPSREVVNRGNYSLPLIHAHRAARAFGYTRDKTVGRIYPKSGPLGVVGRAISRIGVNAVDLLCAPILKASHPAVSLNTRRRLTELYREDIVETGRLTGLDLKDWT